MSQDVKRVWISFGEYGDFTEQLDWNNDDPTKLAERFLEDKFYTYYSFRKIDAGQEFVSVTEHDRIVAELKAENERLKRVIEKLREQRNLWIKSTSYVPENRIRQEDAELAAIERAEGEKE